MMFDILIAALTGAAIGYFLRVSVLAAASFGFVVYSLVSNLAHGAGALQAVGISFLLLGALQVGYICGLLITGLGGNRQGPGSASRSASSPDCSEAGDGKCSPHFKDPKLPEAKL
jgi:hypothetical protein